MRKGDEEVGAKRGRDFSTALEMTNLRKGDGEGEFVILSGARGAKSKNLKRKWDFSTALEMTEGCARNDRGARSPLIPLYARGTEARVSPFAQGGTERGRRYARAGARIKGKNTIYGSAERKRKKKGKLYQKKHFF